MRAIQFRTNKHGTIDLLRPSGLICIKAINYIYEDIQIAHNDYFFSWKPGVAAEASVLHKVIELLLPQLSDWGRKTDIHRQRHNLILET